MKRERGIINIISSAFGQAAAILASLILTRLILVAYGSASNGLINSVNQIFAYFILLEGGVGAASLQALYRPVSEDDRDGVSSIMAATRNYYNKAGILYLAAVLAFAAVYSLLMKDSAGADGISVSAMAGVILFTGLGNVVNFVYQGKYKLLMQAEGRNYVVTNLQTFLTVLACVLKVIGIRFGMPIAAVMGLGFIASLIQTLYYYLYIRRNYRWLDMKAPAAHIGQKSSVMVHQVSQLIFQNTDVIILTAVCGLKTVSVYAAYKVVVSAIGSLTYQLSESVLFVLGQDFASDREGYIRDVDRFDLGYTMVSFMLFAAAMILYRPFIELYTRGITDTEYMLPALPLLFISIELISGCRRAMQNTINVAGHFKATVSRTVTETVINLAVSLALVGRYGIYGVLAGTIAALLYRSNDIIIYGNRRILDRAPWRSYKFYLVNTAAFIPVAVIAGRLDIHFAGYGQFILAGIAAVAACALWFTAVNAVCFGRSLRDVTGLIRRSGR